MRVALFITCVNDTLFPQTGRATVRLLERLGCEVDFPLEQTCCGQMHANSGYGDLAVPLVRRFVRAFADPSYEAIVCPSGSFAAMVHDQFPILAASSGDASLVSAVEDVRSRVWELSLFLTGKLGVEDVGAYFPHRVTYHPTCHSLRALQVGDRPRRLLQAVKGLTLLDLPAAEECCGFGGTFALKNPEVWVSMGADKARHARDTGAEVLCALDNSCLTHIGGILSRERSGMRVLHLAEILASSEEAP